MQNPENISGHLPNEFYRRQDQRQRGLSQNAIVWTLYSKESFNDVQKILQELVPPSTRVIHLILSTETDYRRHGIALRYCK